MLWTMQVIEPEEYVPSPRGAGGVIGEFDQQAQLREVDKIQLGLMIQVEMLYMDQISRTIVSERSSGRMLQTLLC